MNKWRKKEEIQTVCTSDYMLGTEQGRLSPCAEAKIPKEEEAKQIRIRGSWVSQEDPVLVHFLKSTNPFVEGKSAS